MNNINTTFKLTALTAALCSAFGSAFADDEEMRQLTQPESSVSVGAGYWSNDRLQQGGFDGMRDDGLYGLFDAEVVKRNEETGTWFILKGENLGLGTRRLEAEVQQQGNMGGFIIYKRTPRDTPLMVNTGLQGIRGENQTISGAGANALPFREVELGTYRDLIHVGFNKSLMRGLDFKVSFKNEEKSGERHWGLGSQPFFLTEPIDSVTRQLDLILEHTGERLQVSGGYAGSWYDNGNDLVTGTVNGAAQPGSTQSPNPTPLSLPLDNAAHQFFVNAGYSFSNSTRGTIKLSRSVATQDESIPSIGLTGVNAPFVGAPRRLDGEIVTSLVELGLSSRPTRDLSLSGNLRYYDVDDKTPLVGVVGNNATGVATVHNTPHSYTTTSGKFEASYRLPQRFRLIGGIDIKNQDRSAPKFIDERYVPYAEQLDETTYRLQLRRSMSESLNGSIAFLHSDRDGSSRVVPHEPDTLLTGGFVFDAINPLHIADRERNKLRLSLDWSPAEAVGIQFNVEESRDDYKREDGRPFGLQDGKATLVSIDARYQLNDEWQLTGWASHDVTEARRLTGVWPRNTPTSVPSMVRDADLKDTGDSVGLGVRGAVGEKIKLGADLQWTRTQSSYDDDTLPLRTTELPLPDIESTLTRLSLFAKYAVRKNADVRVDFMHERWKTNDWSWSFADGSTFRYGTTTDGTTVAVKPKEVANFVSVRYIYKFQ